MSMNFCFTRSQNSPGICRNQRIPPTLFISSSAFFGGHVLLQLLLLPLVGVLVGVLLQLLPPLVEVLEGVLLQLLWASAFVGLPGLSGCGPLAV